jgi:hypothetical protein
VIETTKGFVFCGFTPAVWDSRGFQADSSEKTFVFTVKDPRGSEGRRFVLANPANAIWCNSPIGRTFGTRHDIWLGTPMPSRSVYKKVGTTFKNDTGIDSRQVLTSGHKFMVKEIEVFAIAL